VTRRAYNGAIHYSCGMAPLSLVARGYRALRWQNQAHPCPLASDACVHPPSSLPPAFSLPLWLSAQPMSSTQLMSSVQLTLWVQLKF
jgi:hypothetical protein